MVSIISKQSFFYSIRLLLVFGLLAATAGICSHSRNCHALEIETSDIHVTVPSTSHSDTDSHHAESKHILDCHCAFHGGLVAMTLPNTSSFYLHRTPFYYQAASLPHLLMADKIDKPPCINA